MSELQNKLNLILNEKTNKILPENIKSGINIFGVSGNVTSVSNNMYTLMKYLPVQVADGYPYTDDSVGGYDFIYPTYMGEPDDYISLPNIFYFSVLDKTNNNFKVYWTDSIGSTYVDYDESNSQLNLHIDTSLPEAVFCSTLQVNNLDVLPLFSDSVNGYNSGWVESLNKYSWNTVNMQGRETSITYNLLDINLEFYASSIRNAADVMQEAKTGSILEGTTAYDKFGNILSGSMPKRTNVAVLNSKIVPSENVININPRYAGYYATNSVLQINNLGLADKIGLTPNILANGVQVLNIVGTMEEGINTSDATATVDDIVLGKTAYVNGVKLTGTLENLEPVIQNQANVINNLYNTVNLLQDEIDTKANAQFMFVLPEGMRFTNSVTVYNNGLNWDVSKTTDISYLFYACNNLTNLNVSEWNTINVTNMRSAFQGCNKLTNLNVTRWDTSNVIQLGSIFYQCSNLRNMDLSNWNTSNLIQMYSMFTYCSNIRNVYMNNWDTSKVNTMSGLFQFCYNLVNINVSNWNTSNVVDMSAMFNDCPNLVNIDVSNWDTSNVERMYQTFAGCSKLKNLDVSNWNTSKVVTMYNTFYTCFNLTNIDVSNWNTSNVTNLNSTFYLCNNLVDINVSNWNINLVTSTYQMFNKCANLVTLNVSNWNSANITAMGQMFNGCNNLSDASIDSIVNMCINAVNVTRKNLSTSNSYSPFCGTNIVNTRYQNRWTELTQSGWVY